VILLYDTKRKCVMRRVCSRSSKHCCKQNHVRSQRPESETLIHVLCNKHFKQAK